MYGSNINKLKHYDFVEGYGFCDVSRYIEYEVFRLNLDKHSKMVTFSLN